MILLLAGTAEGRALAGRLSEAGIEAVASYAGAVERIDKVALPMRIGGFGGDEGFRRYLADHAVTGVIDATHPFADRITRRTHRICDEADVPYLRLARPPWVPGAGDDWHEVARPEDLGRVVPRDARVFLAVGQQELDRYRALEGQEVLLRAITVPNTLPEGWRAVAGRPPFDVDEEVALFRLTGIDWLVCKNAGGTASRAKLDAARRLGLPVAMIARPAPPEGAQVVETVEAALAWAGAS